MKKLFNYSFVIALSFVLVACQQNREMVPISFGKDQCVFCKMSISNPQFGAELITDKGRVNKYDALECMVNHLREENIPYQKIFAVPYDQPKELKAVEDLNYLISPEFRSPMGANLVAYYDLNKVEPQYRPQLLDWNALFESL